MYINGVGSAYLFWAKCKQIYMRTRMFRKLNHWWVIGSVNFLRNGLWLQVSRLKYCFTTSDIYTVYNIFQIGLDRRCAIYISHMSHKAFYISVLMSSEHEPISVKTQHPENPTYSFFQLSKSKHAMLLCEKKISSHQSFVIYWSNDVFIAKSSVIKNSAA